MWARTYFATTGRSPRQDVVVIQPDIAHPGAIWPTDILGTPNRSRLNLLRYEFERGGGLTSNVVDVLFSGLASQEGRGSPDPFWDQALRELLLHAIELSVFGTQLTSGRADIRLDDILEIILSAPTSVEQAESARFKAGRCYALIRAADEVRHGLSEPRFKDLQLSVKYWLQQFPALAPETRSSIVATFTAKVTGLLRSPLRELLCSETDDAVTPERSLNADPMTGHPKVIVVNLPVKLYGDIGCFAQKLIKTVWQHAADRRVAAIERDGPEWRPAFQWADEAQYFITPEDAGFQQTARSAMVATVYLTQNLPNYYAAIGENATHSFLGNLQTKVFHANGEPSTNEWAERVFGNERQGFVTEPISGRAASTQAHSYSPVIPAIRFTELQKGGTTNAQGISRVGAMIFQAGRQWCSKGADRHYHEFAQPDRL
jgi:hypothetical protein